MTMMENILLSFSSGLYHIMTYFLIGANVIRPHLSSDLLKKTNLAYLKRTISIEITIWSDIDPDMFIYGLKEDL
jgi:hypothetical protein